ncbi:MAG: polyphenol oxidase family protein [Candidatus Nanopelagicales bacterium]
MTSHRLDVALPGGARARVLFTGRGSAGSGGSSRSPYAFANLASHVGDAPEAVSANRSALAGALGVPAAAMTFMHPDHGRGVAWVCAPTGVRPGAELQAVDALVTDQPGVGLVALAADCVPVILVDPEAGVVSAVHCGWRGLVVDVVGAAVAEMTSTGAHRQRVQAFLGPAICPDCYPVPAARADQVAEVNAAAVTTAGDGQPALDLRAGLTARLAELGIASSLIGGCTAQDPALFSYRREGRTGRQGGAVAIVAAA